MFIVDLLLIPVFVFVAYSGLRLHAAGHVPADGGTPDHDVWVYQAAFHIVAAVLFIIFGWLHVKAHWGWYRRVFLRNGAVDCGSVDAKSGNGNGSENAKDGGNTVGSRRKSRATVILSALFLVETLTGVFLIAFVEGGNSGVGMWHYVLGLAMIAFFLWHLIRRFAIMVKGLGRRKKK